MLLLQTVVLAVMYVEVITVLIRQQNHFRITRALRPMFFIDNYLMSGVRRYVHDCVCMRRHYYDNIIIIILVNIFLIYHTLYPYSHNLSCASYDNIIGCCVRYFRA